MQLLLIIKLLFLNMSNHQASPPNNEQIKLMKYLDDFDRQINSRKGSLALEEQLASLSKAYNQAQQKLLQTEKALMRESILLQKQRSVIDIYKYALNEELDEQGILYFLQQLEQDESNREIYDDIGEIRTIINRKKMKQIRKIGEEEKMARELKKEVAKLNEDKSVMLQENQSISNTLYQMQIHNEQLQTNLNKLQAELLSKAQTLKQAQFKLQQEAIINKKMKEEIISAKNTAQKLKNTENELSQLKKKWDDLQKILRNKLSWPNKENEDKGNTQNMANKGECFEGLEKKVQQLLKYKAQYKKTKENNELAQFLKKEVSLLKLYLSQQSLQLFKQFEQQKLQCIQTQIRNLAVLQKGTFLKLQECQRDVWKYRIQLIKEDDEETINESAKFLSQTYKHRAAFSKQSSLSNMADTIRGCQEQANPPKSLQLGSNISQFIH